MIILFTVLLFNFPLRSPPKNIDEIVNLVKPQKDVDSHLVKTPNSILVTPMAILWLLAGYNIDLSDKKVLLVGKGKLGWSTA